MKSHIQYKKKAEFMINTYRKQTGKKASDDWSIFLQSIHARAPSLSPSTRRLYRSAFRYYLTEVEKLDWSSISTVDFMQAKENRKQVIEKMGVRTSQLKYKGLPERQWNELILFLINSRSQYAYITRCLLVASYYYGLRPTEWINSKFIDGDESDRPYQRCLVVENAKNSQGRAHGKTRHLWFDIVEEDDNDIIYYLAAQEVIRILSESENPEKLILAARSFLSQVYLRDSRMKKYKGKKRITLYSARHQFAADAKKQGLPKEVIATLMGHRSDETATKSYGLKKWGSSRAIGVDAEPSEVQKVKDFNKKEKISEQEYENQYSGMH